MKGVNQCLILAAGNGSRIASVSRGVPKPLVKFCGVPLLEHVMMSAQQAGIEKFVIVAGYRADSIRSWLNTRSHIGTSVTLIENLQYQKGNGVSALAAKEEFHDPFLLLMADHIFEAKTARALLQQPLAGDEVILGVDRKLDCVFDLQDATKVRRRGSLILEIGKDLAHYNALDTGMFLCSPELFNRLEAAKENGDCSLSDGMRQLAREHKLRAFDIGEARWHDVDSPEALVHAENIFDRTFCANPFVETCSSV
jgi:choline kinase